MAKTRRAARKLHDADRRVARQASRAKDRPPLRLAAIVGEVADQPPLIALGAATLALGLVRRDARTAVAGARMLASHLLATAIKTAIKRSIDRTRPHSVDDGHPYRLEAGDSASHHYSSFPSGHTAGAVAVARAVSRSWPDAGPVAGAIAGGLGAIQVPIGKHYGSDVLAGAAIGWASEAAVFRATRAFDIPA